MFYNDIIEELIDAMVETCFGAKAYKEAGLAGVAEFVRDCRKWGLDEMRFKDEEDITELAKSASQWTDEDIEGLSEMLLNELEKMDLED